MTGPPLSHRETNGMVRPIAAQPEHGKRLNRAMFDRVAQDYFRDLCRLSMNTSGRRRASASCQDRRVSAVRSKEASDDPGQDHAAAAAHARRHDAPQPGHEHPQAATWPRSPASAPTTAARRTSSRSRTCATTSSTWSPAASRPCAESWPSPPKDAGQTRGEVLHCSRCPLSLLPVGLLFDERPFEEHRRTQEPRLSAQCWSKLRGRPMQSIVRCSARSLATSASFVLFLSTATVRVSWSAIPGRPDPHSDRPARVADAARRLGAV